LTPAASAAKGRSSRKKRWRVNGWQWF